jgi:hypothetical protein
MKLLIKLITLLLLTAVYAPSHAAVNKPEFSSCFVFNDGDEKGDKKTEEGDKKTEEEEPDCE